MEDLIALERQLREIELEALHKYKAGTGEPPLLYKPMGLLRAVSEDGGEMTFTASSEDADRMGDVISIDGWELANYKRNNVVMFQHDYSLAPLGTAKVWVDKDAKQLLNTVRFDEEDDFAAFIKGKYSRGIMKAESVGFRPLEFEEIESKGMFGSFKFTKQELLEISLVSIPANPKALRKAMGENRRFTILMPEIPDVRAVKQPKQEPTVPDLVRDLRGVLDKYVITSTTGLFGISAGTATATATTGMSNNPNPDDMAGGAALPAKAPVTPPHDGDISADDMEKVLAALRGAKE